VGGVHCTQYTPCPDSEQRENWKIFYIQYNIDSFPVANAEKRAPNGKLPQKKNKKKAGILWYATGILGYMRYKDGMAPTFCSPSADGSPHHSLSCGKWGWVTFSGRFMAPESVSLPFHFQRFGVCLAPGRQLFHSR